MGACSFFGHRTAGSFLIPEIKTAVVEMINRGVDLFYVGNNGAFDRAVLSALKELRSEYSFRYYIVLAYLPVDKKENHDYDKYETIYPEGLEIVPKRFAILKRNEWMIDHSDYVITYVNNYAGSGAARAKKIAVSKGKTVVELFRG